MNKIIYGLCASLTIFLFFSGCKKNEFNLKENIFVTGKALLKINYFSPYQANPSYQIKIDGNRVSSSLTYATPFPGGGLNTGGGSTADYLAVEPGSRKITISRPFFGTANDSIELASATITVAAEKAYSLYFADTAMNTFSMLVEDDHSLPDSGLTKFRLINLIPDLPTVDLYFGTDTTVTTSTKVAGPIAYKSLSNYFTIPINTGSVWAIRAGGSAANSLVYSRYVSTSTVVNQRVFTISTRGYNSITAAADVRRRIFSFIYNR